MVRLKPTHLQDCGYCHQNFVPAKRGTQRFCSASCRTSYCRKKRAGTLGRFTQLPTPAAVQPAHSFGQIVLASGLGALGANTISQTAEYLLVTKAQGEKIDKLTKLVEQLMHHQANSAHANRSGLYALLIRGGVSPDVARKGLGLPEMAEIQPLPVVRSPEAFSSQLKDAY